MAHFRFTRHTTSLQIYALLQGWVYATNPSLQQGHLAWAGGVLLHRPYRYSHHKWRIRIVYCSYDAGEVTGLLGNTLDPVTLQLQQQTLRLGPDLQV